MYHLQRRRRVRLLVDPIGRRGTGWVGSSGLALAAALALLPQVLWIQEAHPSPAEKAQRRPLFPGLEEGVSEGVVILPAVFEGFQPVEILEPTEFQVHLTDADNPVEELEYPAGQGFVPPIGRWRLWLEGPSKMTPFTDLINIKGSDPRGHKLVKPMPVVPAGLVHVPSDLEIADEKLELRLLYLESDSESIRHELTRRKRLEELQDGLLMPEGAVVASLWSPEQNRYVALSRPFQVRSGDSVAAPLETPSQTLSHLVVYVDRPDDAASLWGNGVELVLIQEGERKPPHDGVTTPWGTYRIWYDLDPGTVQLEGGNEGLYLEPARILLQGGQVHRFQRRLTERPF